MNPPGARSSESTWVRQLLATGYEQDPFFRSAILRLSRRGMRVAGVLGFLVVLLFVVGHRATGDPVVLGYTTEDAIVIWDKIAVLLTSMALVGLSFTPSGARWGRLLVGIGLITVVVASTIDDLLGGDVRFAGGWVSLAMLVAVGTVPYRPLQFLGLGAATVGSTLFCLFVVPIAMGMPIPMEWGQLVQLTIVMLLCVVIVTLLYNTRFEQYLALKQSRELTERVASQAEQLRRLEEQKDRFFANISHEFRSSLTLVLGPVHDGLSDAYGQIEGRLRQAFVLMQRNGVRLLKLVNELLDLAKLDSGRMHLHVTRNDARRFVAYLVSSFRWLAERKSIALSYQCADDVAEASFDREKIGKALMNLISNALKFTPAHGKVHVSVRRSARDADDFLEISVHDTGPGISEDQIPQVFERFYQGGPTGEGIPTGSGVGLALVRELVELHHGSVAVKSEPGFGSTFTVRLPLAASRYAPEEILAEGVSATEQLEVHGWELPQYELDLQEEAAPSDRPEESAELPAVLVVDDEPDVRVYLKSLLRDAYRVLEAADGQEALDLMRSERPDLVISDIMMPKIDGIMLCRKAKADAGLNHIPIVLLTARVGDEGHTEGLLSGADDFVVKPFNAEMLLARVENLIEIRRQLRHRFSDEIVLKPAEVVVQSADAELLHRVQEVVESHMGNGNFGVEWLADEIGMSPRHLQRKMRSLTRLSAKGFINMMRLERAAQLIQQHAGNVSEVAYQVGFQDAGYFSKLFKQSFGVTPTAYQTANGAK